MARTRNRIGLLTAATVAALTAAMTVAGGGVAAAAPRASVGPNTVSVSGHGSVKGVPDTLIADLDVHATEATVQAALDASSAAASDVIASLKANGVPDNDIQTSGLSVGPTYGRHGKRTGYRADESITARIHDLSTAGTTLGAATTAGGNHVSIDDASLAISNKAKFAARARAAAFANAEAAASQYADLAGQSLGRVMSIKATVHGTANRRIEVGASGASGGTAPVPSIPIQPGQQKITASVHVVWRMH